MESQIGMRIMHLTMSVQFPKEESKLQKKWVDILVI